MLPNFKLEGLRSETISSSPEKTDGPEITIPFTTLAAAQRSIYLAESLCQGLNAKLRVICPVMVPYVVDIDQPKVAVSALVNKMSSLEATLPMRIDIRLCRDAERCFLDALEHEALIFIAYQPRFVTTAEEKLGRFLKKAGHYVTLFPVEEKL